MNIVQMLSLALVATFLSVLLKNYRPEFSLCVALIFGTIFLLYVCKTVEGVFGNIIEICNSVGINVVYIEIMFKVIGVSYMCEFISSLCKDAGETSIAVKVDIAGKLIILSASIPVFKELISLIAKVPL